MFSKVLSVLVRWALAVEVMHRRPGQLYLTRYYLLGWVGRLFKRFLPLNLYLQHFSLSDEPTPHNHPRWFLSLILKGGYQEWRITPTTGTSFRYDVVDFAPGCVNWIPPHRYHWVDLKKRDCWTVCVVGPSFGRRWGFWHKGKHVDAVDYKRDVLGHERVRSGAL